MREFRNGCAHMILNPARHIFSRAITHAGDVVQCVVVESVNDCARPIFDVCEVHHPADFGINCALYPDCHLIRVAVQSSRPIGCAAARVSVGGLKSEFAFDDHRSTSDQQ